MAKNIRKKIISCFVAVLLVLSGLSVPAGMFKNTANASVSSYEAKVSDYYNQLNRKSKLFYDAIHQMNTSGALKTGIENFDIVSAGIVSASDVEGYSNGNKQLLVDFASAKDAYFLDHPEVFYVDFDKFSLSLGTKNGGVYATIGTGRTNSYLADGFSSSSQIDTDIAYVNSKLSVDLDGLTTIEEKIKAINMFILPKTRYGFEDSLEPHAKYHIRSVFGFAKFGLSVCEGYTKAFKYICDKNGIECKEVVGYLIDSASDSTEPHAWNVVKLDNGNWYAVDITLNDAHVNPEHHLFIGSEEFDKDHIADGKVSNNIFEFEYPTIALYNLGDEKLTTKTKYIKDENGYANMVVEVSFNGKNVKQLKEEDGIYTAIAYQLKNSEIWQKPFVVHDIEILVKHFEGYSEYYLQDYYKVQFFATTTAPSVELGVPATGYPAPIDNPTAKSNIIQNEYYELDERNNAPAIASSVKFEANGKVHTSLNALPVEQTYFVTVVYDEEIKINNESLDVEITLTSANEPNISNYAKIENVVFDGEKTITFNFTPSLNFKHHYLSYGFTPFNIITTSNNGLPQTFYASFRRKEVICSKILDGGRLYLSATATPVLLDNSDLSVAGWAYDDSGISRVAVENQRSQMALVVSRPKNSIQKQIDETINEKEEYVYESQTYELDINICSGLASIPNGSYVKLALPFPDGYDYSSLDEGLTFKVYHFKKDSYGSIDYDNPVLMNVAITEYGLVVETDSFSPFAIVVVDGQEDDAKVVYARAINDYGKILTDGKSIANLTNGSVTFDITPNENYVVDYLLLNGKDITNRIEDGKITLTYDELNSNSKLDVAFVHEDVKTYEEVNGIEIYNKSFNQNQRAFETYVATNNNSNNGNPITTILICAGVGAVVGVSVSLVIYFISKKKRKNKV